MTDTEREKKIQEHAQEIIEKHKAGDINRARVCFHTMATLIAGRSDEQIKKMEQRMCCGKN